VLPNYKDIIDLIKKGSTIEAQEKIMELREGAIELQEQNIELRQKVRELERQLSAIGDWEAEKNRYLLVAPWRGPAQVYALRESQSQGQRPHFLCTNCFHNSKRVVINPAKSKEGWVSLVCPTCKSSVDTGYRGIGEAEYAEKYLEPDDSSPAA
jgi:hypothetical protein